MLNVCVTPTCTKRSSYDGQQKYILRQPGQQKLSPGLVVMGRDFQSEGCGFASQHCILDGHIFNINLLKNCYVCLKKTVNKLKMAGVGPIKKLSLLLIQLGLCHSICSCLCENIFDRSECVELERPPTTTTTTTKLS